MEKYYYDPEVINISTGTTMEWVNEDAAMHTATSGSPTSGADGVFDSQILNIGRYISIHIWRCREL